MKRFLAFALFFIATGTFGQNKFDPGAVADFQRQLNANFADPEKSPLPKADIVDFKSLDFYPPNPAFFVQARFVRTPDEKPFQMPTSTDRLPLYVKYGTLHFEIDGVSCMLNLYQNVAYAKKEGHEDTLFLPFSDLTSGNETYIGGRYIDMKIPLGNSVTIDFNKAYNPYCAYSYRYSCPKIPLENDLPVAVRAGVKKYHD